MQQIQTTIINAMLNNGMTPPDTLILDGELHRFKDESGKQNCYYVAYVDGRAAGMIGDWKTGLKVKWKAEGNYPKLTEAQRTEFKLEQQKQQQLRKAEEKSRQDKAAQKAAHIWKQSKPVTQHSYLTKKRIDHHNSRLHTNSLVIPIFNNGVLASLQFIDKDGNKRFLTGGKLKGSYSQLGIYDANKPILICEGWATGASLYESTDNLTYVAFSAGNLKAVAVHVRSLYPINDIIIMGDNDLSGVGQAAAREAALSIGGKYLIPETIGRDWNDAINMEVLV
jgi:putative DNA primase/helicase